MTAGLVFAGVLTAAGVGYLHLTLRLVRRGASWPLRRPLFWLCGLLAAGFALVGPPATAHHDFSAHMLGHLLVGMVGPLFLVLAAPVTLALRALPQERARRVGHVLRSAPATVLTHPATASALNLGGLWLLYRGGVYPLMSDDQAVSFLVHLHVLAAGYLFTYAILAGPDPAPHAPGPSWRAGFLVLSVAAHNILAKSLYADPPPGVPAEQAVEGSQLMYYGGAPVEITLFALVCLRWYRSTRLAGPVTGRTSCR
ncbi:putative membrane protein [Amycolatopsis marina]|uniref:Putative membrane protein n=1 Tax=Amycolatopsis marina TaxID=490629 RepID=A0A1I0ZT76_9PSEU|nr:cytochrome c oxidase assembly protein [Amycolatopsis marina]SFB28989.1 putative membrane protein [Amycolatopsis marina]